MIIAANLPKFLWTEAVQHATWLKNRTPTRVLNGMTPYEVRYNTKADLTALPKWGARVYVLKESCGKLEPRADEVRWMGYSSDTKGHQIYWPGKCHVIVECNVSTNAPPSPAPSASEPPASLPPLIPVGRTDGSDLPQLDPLKNFESIAPEHQA
ncbi:hypothetical protein K439DRAFT_1360593 [Ramaria rubella]|nr:hypothetical protein K439DRAFT_1360593 [Ramaria rubella]